MRLILASGSPRRRLLLQQMGFSHFTVLSSDVDEHVDGSVPPGELVKLLSARKAAAVASGAEPDAVILAADTVVALDGLILGKPENRKAARAMLSALSGREHQVYTGFTLRQGGRVLTDCDETSVTFRALTAEEISAYVATGEPMDKAGGYGIQGLGALLVKGIRGDYFNVVGLPVCRLGLALREFGLEPLTSKEKRSEGLSAK
ncbi:MAG: Maf family protein [Intestinimonas sp.]|jgi:septum formation protein|nr:Maf family protein [Intestinimonas sp.]